MLQPNALQPMHCPPSCQVQPQRRGSIQVALNDVDDSIRRHHQDSLGRQPRRPPASLPPPPTPQQPPQPLLQNATRTPPHNRPKRAGGERSQAPAPAAASVRPQPQPQLPRQTPPQPDRGGGFGPSGSGGGNVPGLGGTSGAGFSSSPSFGGAGLVGFNSPLPTAPASGQIPERYRQQAHSLLLEQQVERLEVRLPLALSAHGTRPCLLMAATLLPLCTAVGAMCEPVRACAVWKRGSTLCCRPQHLSPSVSTPCPM